MLSPASRDRKIVLCVIAGALLAVSSIEAQSIFTVAGGVSDDGRPATLVPLSFPVGLAFDSSGNLYIADPDSYRIRRVGADDGIISTIAGNGEIGFGGDGGPATEATLGGPIDLAFDQAGNLYLSDNDNDRIRRIDASTGIISTIAGNGSSGFEGEGGPATLASLNNPTAMAFDEDGNLYFADMENDRIRRIDVFTGSISTVAGNGDRDFSGDGGPATLASLYNPDGLAIDAAGNLLVSDKQNHRIRRVDATTGIISTVVGTGDAGFEGDGGPATLASIRLPSGLAIDSRGDLYIATLFDGRVRRVNAATGDVFTAAGNGAGGFSGDGGPATEAGMGPLRLAFDADDNLYVSDSFQGRVRSIDGATEIITTVAGNGREVFGENGDRAVHVSLQTPTALAIDATGNLYISELWRVRRVDADRGRIFAIAGRSVPGYHDDGIPAIEAFLNYPEGLALDSEGNLLIADASNRHVCRIDGVTGLIHIVAGNGESRFAGDGGPATEASLLPHDLALDAENNLYISDSFNDRVLRVDAVSGLIATIAGDGTRGFSGDGGPATLARFRDPTGIALDPDGNLHIADLVNHRIRRIEHSTGIITTVAGDGSRGYRGDGGPATMASLDFPRDIAFDSAGDLYIADWKNARVRRVNMTTGVITTVAGDGEPHFSGDDGPATRASLNDPQGVSIDANDDLYITDGRRVRVVPACIEMTGPELQSPSNGSSGIMTSTNVSWKAQRGAFRYDVYLDEASPPRRIVASDIETTSLSLSGLSPLTTYYWKVVAKGDPYCDPFRTAESEIWSFTTTSSCEVPEPAAP